MGQIITCMLFSWLSDKYKNRSIFLSIQALICLVGLALVAFAKDNGVRYLGKDQQFSQIGLEKPICCPSIRDVLDKRWQHRNYSWCSGLG